MICLGNDEGVEMVNADVSGDILHDIVEEGDERSAKTAPRRRRPHPQKTYLTFGHAGRFAEAR
jgi:hypothetical protein